MSWEIDHQRQAAFDAMLKQRAPEGWKGVAPVAYVDPGRRLHALLSRDDIAVNGTPDDRWHISLRHEERVPSWDELAAAGHELRPGVCFAIGVPPRSWWVNVHENVLHLYEIKDDNLTDQWRAEAQGHTPTPGGRR